MCAFVVFGLVFFRYCAEWLAEKSLHEITFLCQVLLCIVSDFLLCCLPSESVLCLLPLVFCRCSYISKRLRTKFDVLAESLLPSLVALLPNSARVMSSSAVVTISFIIAVSLLLHWSNDWCLSIVSVSPFVFVVRCIKPVEYYQSWPTGFKDIQKWWKIISINILFTYFVPPPSCRWGKRHHVFGLSVHLCVVAYAWASVGAQAETFSDWLAFKF